MSRRLAERWTARVYGRRQGAIRTSLLLQIDVKTFCSVDRALHTAHQRGRGGREALSGSCGLHSASSRGDCKTRPECLEGVDRRAENRLRADAYYDCVKGSSPERDQTCSGKLSLPSFREGMGLGVKEQTAAHREGLKFLVQSDVIVW